MVEHTRVAGIDVEWDPEAGVHRWGGQPALALWLESSVAGLMSGLHRMVGTERFNLSMIAGGRDSTEGDWGYIGGFPAFEEGFAALSMVAGAAGWGRWEIASLDREKKEARFRVRNSWEAGYQRALEVTWGSSYIAGKFAGLCARLFNTNCWPEQTRFAVRGDEVDEFIVTASTTTVENEIEGLLASDKATRADLAIALEKLRSEVDERHRVEQELLEKLALIETQEQAIRALSTPIIRVWDGVLALPLVGTIDGKRSAEMTERLLAEVVRTGTRYTILDVTGVEVVDSPTADHLIRITRAVRLLGARSVITGIRPAVAQTMASLGMDLSAVVTLGNLQEGLTACMKWIDEERRAGGRA